MYAGEDYIGHHVDLDTEFNHVVLEASLRAIESDTNVPPYAESHRIDLRVLEHVETVAALRRLIRMGGFALDLNKYKGMPVEYYTPYSRQAKRGWSTDHWMIQTSKGWIGFDFNVETMIEVRK